MAPFFGTDGVRGVANRLPMTVDVITAVGRAIVRSQCQDGERRIIVGRDTCRSSTMLEAALCAGVCSEGADIITTGVLPTPGIAALTKELHADAGVIISASHNPFEDNGLKVFGRDGFKLSDEAEAALEREIRLEPTPTDAPTGTAVGSVGTLKDAAERYLDFCIHSADHVGGADLRGMKIVVDSSHGATSQFARNAFTMLGATVTAIGRHPDGCNINAGCGSQDTALLARTVLETDSDFGLAFDGDGDRIVAVDECGETLSGDHILGMLAIAMKAAGTLAGNLVVLTPMSNLGLRLAFDRIGIGHEDAGIGYRNVLYRMLQRKAVLGGEQSGHVILLDRHTTGDGIVAGIELARVIKASRQPLSALGDFYREAPQRLINVAVASKPPLESVAPLKKAIQEAEERLGNSGRVLVRYSGTQAICRVMVEAEDESLTQELADSLAQLVRKELG
jgi:phosphoglucosamine mutase